MHYVCKNCGGIFSPKDKRRNQFCSVICRGISRRKRCELVCSFCGIVFTTRIKTRKFCSKRCHGLSQIKTSSFVKKCLFCQGNIIRKLGVSLSHYLDRYKFCSRLCSSNFKIGKPHPHSKQTIEKMSKARFGQRRSSETRDKMRNRKVGIRLSRQHRLRIKDAHIRRVLAGKHNNFQNWITPKNKLIRGSSLYKIWREAVFERDDYTCQRCKTRGVFLHPHHIQNFAQWPELRFVVDNGITLCKKDHERFHREYGNRDNNREQIFEYINKL